MSIPAESITKCETFCKSVVKVSNNVSIEWLDVPIVVSSANMSGTSK